jgi:hypothetical protein
MRCIVRKLFRIIRSERSRGGRRLRIIALATSRVVAAPSICEEVIASSISELNR